MKSAGNTVLITGGATGIGFALAGAFAKAGNKVIICGRRKAKLAEAKHKLPGLLTTTCDVSRPEQRQALFDWAKANHEGLNILVNNAGIQRNVDLKAGARDLLAGGDEIATNFAAPVHLSALFTSMLLRQPEAAIVNVSSGLGFVPIAAMPVYCATKAAVHLFTVSLRHQMKGTPVKIFEVVPPMVDTDLGKGTTDEPDAGHRGVPPSVVAEAVMEGLKKDEFEIVVGEAKDLLAGARSDFEKTFQRLNSW